ncbi:hypothetical protein GGI21_001945, partial [Coemansia aciculifera]
MLYPRRLILVDRSSFQTKAPDHSHEPTTLTTVEPIGLDAYVPKLPDTAIISGDSALDVAGSKPTPNAMRSDSSELSELEEGEDFEDGEEGEISDPAESIPVAPRAVPVDSELDAVVESLHPDAPSVPELSLTAIRESMSLFQNELRAEQEAEQEARRREQLASISAKREFPTLDAAMANGNKLSSSNAKSAASGGGGTRKRQRSNARDEASNKSRKKSVSATSATTKPGKANSAGAAASAALAPTGATINKTEPLSSSIALGDNASGPVGAINMLFGEAGVGEEAASLVVGAEDMSAEGGMVGAPADLSESFGQIGDDMELGMGLGMGDNLDVDMGGFTNSLFGVTDDDFDFFDSVPAANQQQQQQQQLVQPKTEPAMPLPSSSLTIHSSADNNTLLAGADALSINHSIDALDASGLDDPPAQDDMEDLFDEGMFDSFFGGPVSAASLGNESTSINAPPLSVIKEESVARSSTTLDCLNMEADSGSSRVLEEPRIATLGLLHSLSSPPGMTSVASAETHIGTGDSMPAVAVSVDFATPSSIKITPAPSADLQTPTPTINSLNGSKLPKTINDDSEAMDAHLTTPARVQGLSNDASMYSATHVLPYVAAVATTAETLAKAKPGMGVVGGMARPVKANMTPQPYCSINTPYDNIGTSSRSWLQDHPTPIQTSGEAAAACSPDLDSPTVQYSSLVEKSLNPVAWIKRVSARRIQHSAALRRRRHSANASSTLPSSSASNSQLSSVRLLRAWLTKYKARLLYAKDFVPGYIKAAKIADLRSGMAPADVIANV